MCDHVGAEHAWRILDIAIACDHLLKADGAQSKGTQHDEETGKDRDSPAQEPSKAAHFVERKVAPHDVCWILSLREVQSVFSRILNLL